MSDLLDQLPLAAEIEQSAGSKSLAYKRRRLVLAPDSVISRHCFASELLAVGAQTKLGQSLTPLGLLTFQASSPLRPSRVNSVVGILRMRGPTCTKRSLPVFIIR